MSFSPIRSPLRPGSSLSSRSITTGRARCHHSVPVARCRASGKVCGLERWDCFTIAATVPITTAPGTSCINEATVTSSSPQRYPLLYYDGVAGPCVVGSGTDLAATVSAPAGATAGGEFDYAFGVANLGPIEAQAVSLAFAMPTGTTLRSFSQSSRADVWLHSAARGGHRHCDVHDVRAGGERHRGVRPQGQGRWCAGRRTDRGERQRVHDDSRGESRQQHRQPYDARVVGGARRLDRRHGRRIRDVVAGGDQLSGETPRAVRMELDRAIDARPRPPDRCSAAGPARAPAPARA